MEAKARSMEDLLWAAAAGDERAWEALVAEFTPLLRRVAHGFRLDAHRVDDAVQDTWLRLVLHIKSIERPAAAPGWLVTTVRREALRTLRGNRREVACAELPVADAGDGALVDELAIAAERRAALHRALAHLPERERALLAGLLAEPADGYAGVAAALAIPVGSIGPTRARAFARLRQDPRLLRAVA